MEIINQNLINSIESKYSEELDEKKLNIMKLEEEIFK